MTAAELLGDEWPDQPPERNSREELRLARRVTRLLAERIDDQLDELVARSADPPDHPRRWRWLTRLMR